MDDSMYFDPKPKKKRVDLYDREKEIEHFRMIRSSG